MNHLTPYEEANVLPAAAAHMNTVQSQDHNQDALPLWSSVMTTSSNSNSSSSETNSSIGGEKNGNVIVTASDAPRDLEHFYYHCSSSSSAIFPPLHNRRLFIAPNHILRTRLFRLSPPHLRQLAITLALALVSILATTHINIKIDSTILKISWFSNELNWRWG
jgi:hypothetical protein